MRRAQRWRGRPSDGSRIVAASPGVAPRATETSSASLAAERERTDPVERREHRADPRVVLAPRWTR